MCRWIIYLGEQRLMLEDLLIKPDHCIVDQTSVRFLPGLYYGLEDSDKEDLKKQATWINVHGFGVAWYTDTLAEFDPSVKGMQPALFKTIAPISSDIAFHQLCAHTASKCTLAHIRNASFVPVVEVNNHPFVFGKYSFMHNGGVNNFAVIRYDVLTRIFELQQVMKSDPMAQSSVANGNYIFEIKGNTDTEHLATLFFAHLDIVRAGILAVNASREAPNAPKGVSSLGVPFHIDSTDALLLALIETISDIHRIQEIHGVGPFSGDPKVGNSLNLCIADGGEQLLTCRWRDAEETYPPSLYLSLTAGEKLNRKHTEVLPMPEDSHNIDNENVRIHSVRELVANYEPTQQGKHVVIGSEPCTLEVDDWGLFDRNQAVTLDRDGTLRILDLAKFFRPGREHEFEQYKFNTVFSGINTMEANAPDIGVPKLSLDQLPSATFETTLHLK